MFEIGGNWGGKEKTKSNGKEISKGKEVLKGVGVDYVNQEGS